MNKSAISRSTLLTITPSSGFIFKSMDIVLATAGTLPLLFKYFRYNHLMLPSKIAARIFSLSSGVAGTGWL